MARADNGRILALPPSLQRWGESSRADPEPARRGLVPPTIPTASWLWPVPAREHLSCREEPTTTGCTANKSPGAIPHS
jgi:hypothetical protein